MSVPGDKATWAQGNQQDGQGGQLQPPALINRFLDGGPASAGLPFSRNQIGARNFYRPIVGGRPMSKASKKLRDAAAHELRESRNGRTMEEKKKNKKRAAAYKSLAQSEEWLQGEPE